MSIRTERVAGEIQKALASPLRTIASEIAAGFISVTEVCLSADLQIARVYLSVFGGKCTPAEALTQIEQHYMGRVRHHLATSLRLRYTPQLQFFIDDSLDRAQRIEAILDRVRPVDEAHPDGTETNE